MDAPIYQVEILNRVLSSYRNEGHFESASNAANHAIELASKCRSFCRFRVIKRNLATGGDPVTGWIDGEKR
jgi:hypothetical protein